MPIGFSAILSGKDSLELEAKTSVAFVDNLTGGSTIAAFPAKGAFGCAAAVDHYAYRNFEGKASVGFDLEIYDAEGRLKWAEDPDFR